VGPAAGTDGTVEGVYGAVELHGRTNCTNTDVTSKTCLRGKRNMNRPIRMLRSGILPDYLAWRPARLNYGPRRKSTGGVRPQDHPLGPRRPPGPPKLRTQAEEYRRRSPPGPPPGGRRPPGPPDLRTQEEEYRRYEQYGGTPSERSSSSISEQKRQSRQYTKKLDKWKAPDWVHDERRRARENWSVGSAPDRPRHTTKPHELQQRRSGSLDLQHTDSQTRGSMSDIHGGDHEGMKRVAQVAGKVALGVGTVGLRVRKISGRKDVRVWCASRYGSHYDAREGAKIFI